VSRTIVFDVPRRARAFFEALIADNIGVGRPEEVSVGFARQVPKTTPGVFRTRVFTQGTQGKLDLGYKRCRVKQYLKEGRALRIETVVNHPRDLGVLSRLEHLPELITKARAVNRRLLTIQRAGQGCAIETALFARISQPYAWEGQRTGALRFGDPRAMALAGALCMVVHAVAGFSNRSLRALVAGLLGTTYTASQMTYDLRRLRRQGSSSAGPAPTPTCPPTASGWRCSTPRSTTGCWRRCWPPTTHRHHPRSATPYAWSTRPWPTPSPAHAWASPLETCHNVSSPGPQEGLGPGGNQASNSPASLTRPRAGLRERTRTRARGRCRTRAGAAGWR
jgi:hypothetical protein